MVGGLYRMEKKNGLKKKKVNNKWRYRWFNISHYRSRSYHYYFDFIFDNMKKRSEISVISIIIFIFSVKINRKKKFFKTFSATI